ncbi:MAG: patatin-like phospholipase family protein [Gemmatimonadota bacterium]
MTRDLALTLAGGGNRAFYQLGVLRQWWPALEPRIRAIAACSAGACVAALLLSGRDEVSHEYWLGRREHVRKNFDWMKLLRGERPTPQYPIYRDTMIHALEHGGLERIQALPFPVWVLTAELPFGLPAPLAILFGLGAYSLERHRSPGTLHPSSGRRLGFQPIAIDLRTVGSPVEGADLILASSATPPFTPVGTIGGRRVLDGGVVDNAPAFLAEREPGWSRHLVLLTRPYPRTAVGWKPPRWYVCPERPVPVNRWDYTRPHAIQETIEQGEREALARGPQLSRFLEGDL